MKKRLRNRIFAVIGVFSLILPLFLVPVSADYSGLGWKIEKEDGLWVVQFDVPSSSARPYSLLYYYANNSLRARAQGVGSVGNNPGFYLTSVSSDYASRWVAFDIPLFVDTYFTDSPAYIKTKGINLSGLPLGVEVEISLDVSGSFSNISDSSVFDALSLYDLPYGQELSFGDSVEKGFLIPFYGSKLPLTFERSALGTSTVYKTSFLSSGNDVYNFAIHYERYAGYDYSSPLFVLPQIKLRFTTDQLEQLIASQKYNAGLTKQIADALKADPEVQREIQNKKEEQSRFEDELSQGLQDMSIPDISIEVPEISIPYPDEAFHMMDFIYEIPGVLFLVSLCASLWICGLILFGKREGGK